jgi:hypothetical protein
MHVLALGGSPTGFHVTFLKDQHIRFSVASKHVGFAVCDLKRVITESLEGLGEGGGIIEVWNGKGGKRRKMRHGCLSRVVRANMFVLSESPL